MNSSTQQDHDLTVSEVLPGLLQYMTVERPYSPATILTYQKNIRQLLHHVGDLPVKEIQLHHIISLKSVLAERGVGEAHLGTVISAVKLLLRYARDVRKIPVLDLTSLRPPRAARSAVISLTKEELNRFFEAIPLRRKDSEPLLAGYRTRALAETLLASAMRISEAVSLNRVSINFQHAEARIVGGHQKERTVPLTDGALRWISQYLALRPDHGQPLFATVDGSRLKPNSVATMFQKVARLAGLEKPVSPRVIRHTAAMNLLRSGWSLASVQEILGHANIESTSRIYLGFPDKAELRDARLSHANSAAQDAVDMHGPETGCNA